MKAASVFPGNAAGGRPNIHSVVLLFDGECGAPVAVIHGEAFTRMKTAAGSALAASILSRPDAAILTVIGAGAQAETHIRFLLAVRPSIRHVTICNRTPDRALALAERIGRLGVEAEATTDIAAAVQSADIVSCLTASHLPVLEGRHLRPGAHVDLVGGFTPDMREADDETVRRGRLFADTRRFTLTVCGDFSQPLRDGIISEGDILADLFELSGGAHPGRGSDEEITVFKSGGGGHLDLMMARAILDLQTNEALSVRS